MKNNLLSPRFYFAVIEKGVCVFSLALLTLLPVLDAALRFFWTARFPAAPELIAHLLLVLGLVSGMLTTKENSHLSIGLFHYIKNERTKKNLAALTSLVSLFMITIFFWCSLSFIRVGLYPTRIIGFIPDRIFALAMPLGYAVMAFRFFRRAKLPVPALIALVAGSAASLPSIFKLIWALDIPETAWVISEFFYAAGGLLKLPVIIALVVCAVTGTPLFVVIGGFALILLQSGGSEIDTVASQIYTSLTQNNLVAIPLFTLSGFILSESKAGDRLVETFKGLFGWGPGGMIVVTVIICAFFTSFTGASGVTILALGGILTTVLSGYPEKFKIGLLTASGSIGLLFPPSLPILLTGAQTRTNTLNLFLGAFLPGILLVAATIVFGIAVSLKSNIAREPFNLRRAAAGLKRSLPEIILPFLLIAGYFSGVLSLVEVSAAAVVYVLAVELIRGELNIKSLGTVLKKSIPIIGGVLSILALSQALAYYILDSRVPEFFAQWMKRTVESKWVFLLLLNLALLVTGCLLDIFSAIMIILPLIFPLGVVYGIDPVHLGIIFLVNMEAGFLTPPVGLNLFLASYRFEKPFTETSRNVLPFLIIQLIVLFVVTYVPFITMALVPRP